MQDGSATFSFSTDQLGGRDRHTALRDSLRQMLQLDIAPLTEDQPRMGFTTRMWTGLKITSGSISPIRATRTRALLADGDDGLCMVYAASNAGHVEGLGRELAIGAREAIFLRRTDATSIAFPRDSRFMSIDLPAAALGPLLRDRTAAFMRPIPAQSEALRLLVHFAEVLQKTNAERSAELQRLSVNYVYDLMAVALGATRDTAEAAEHRGVRAARLRAIKDDILAALHDPNLNVGALARRHRVTPRYIQMLFDSDGTTFSHFLRKERLERARAMLGNPGYAALPISTIAFEAGFGDLSHFNHMFRSAYGMTPSDVRAASQGKPRGRDRHVGSNGVRKLPPQ